MASLPFVFTYAVNIHLVFFVVNNKFPVDIKWGEWQYLIMNKGVHSVLFICTEWRHFLFLDQKSGG